MSRDEAPLDAPRAGSAGGGHVRWGHALAEHLAGAAILGLVMLGSLLVGAVRIDPIAALRAPAESAAHVILVSARLPRVVLGALVGGALGLSGAGLQALLQNPLACPHVLGISGGAALAGILAMIAAPLLPLLAGGGVKLALVVVPAAAFVGALGTAALVQSVAGTSGRLTPHALILTGVVFNAFAAALITFVNSLADFYQAQGVLSWVIGNLTVRGNAWTGVVVATLVAGLLLLAGSARDLNALGLGEEGALGLGVDVDRARRRVYLGVALLLAGAVPASGMIGFVGLIVPHVVRIFVGSDQRRVLPASMWGGAAFLVLADTIARTILAPTELPVGVITALAGGPFFLVLLRRQSRLATVS
ncbi:MAG TPA: iron ABC transporter permease [Candidatus Bathyarchaeia archaeon]|nr:iron ABC transporter permease [Candidatus Bathyarchaeia archaeon]